MPGKHDFVNYGAYGVCQVEDIRPIRFGPDTPRRSITFSSRSARMGQYLCAGR